MLLYNEILPKKYIELDGEPYEVLSSSFAKKSRQKPVNNTKLRNLITGRVTDKAFHQSDKVKQADISKKTIIYLYNNRGEYWFKDTDNPKNRFRLLDSIIGRSSQFMKENSEVEGLVFNENIISMKLPIKVDLIVSEAPPSIRGNTSQGGNKQVVLETGASISTPLFINEGDTIRANTETGEYVERVEKK